MDNCYKYGVVRNLDGQIVGFNLSPDVFVGLTDEEIEKALEAYAKRKHELPSVQPDQKEITMEDVKAYCEPRNLVVLTKELFDQMNNTADKIYLYLKDRERR